MSDRVARRLVVVRCSMFVRRSFVRCFVRPFVRSSVRPSPFVRQSVRPSVRSFARRLHAGHVDRSFVMIVCEEPLAQPLAQARNERR